MKKVRVRLGNRSYSVHIGQGMLDEAGLLLQDLGFSGRAVIVTHPNLRKLYGGILEESLASRSFKVSVLEVPEGEEQKSLETAGRLYEELTDAFTERTTPILALGGGVIGDLTGFVAATYLRGVPFVQVPTSLLAQVDSSIGGKVAVNHGTMKNKIGAFYQPRLVIADIDVLKTVDLTDGLAEAIKYGVILDASFFSYLERNIDRIKARDARALETVVYRSAKTKADVVSQDETDLGLRAILNYGHTVGHAVESVSDFGISHGQAVAIGMVAAAKISNRMGMLSDADVARIKELIVRAGLPVELPLLEITRLMHAMKHDKKVLQGRIRFVLPRTVGEVVISDGVNNSLVEQVFLEGK
ncbi:MAG: 3-dehydroquinate synthase [Dehalococcoidales bacterium]|nr:3-dehydroquinate synthase [Dehalococcoidales bacterium]